MEEIILDLQDMHDLPNWMVNIDGIYSYLNRKPNPNIDILRTICKSDVDDVTKYLLSLAVKEYQVFSNHSSTERYIEKMPAVFVDKYNTLEIMGAMRYDKQYTLFYDLSEQLDFCLAGAFSGDVKMIRERLYEKCQRYNISYIKLSQAVLLGDMSLLKGINMQIFIDLSSELNDYIDALMINQQSFKYAVGNRIVSLADSRYTHEARIATFVMHKVLFFAQFVINMIINLFKCNEEPFISGATCMLLSKGLYNVVFTAKSNNYPVLHFKYRGNNLVLNPKEVSF